NQPVLGHDGGQTTGEFPVGEIFHGGLPVERIRGEVRSWVQYHRMADNKTSIKKPPAFRGLRGLPCACLALTSGCVARKTRKKGLTKKAIACYHD
ncbi:MAG: hypothetical protein WAK57_11550, partial [Desulfobacterales bacterium]